MSAYDGAIRINTKLNTKGFDNGINSMRATLGKFATVVGMAFSITALVKMGQQAIELASDIQEVDNVVSKSFGNMRSEMDALADSAIKNLGMSRLTAYQTGSTFMSMGKNMLDSATDAKDMALALTKLTGNMSSFYNVTQDIASTALKSIYTGETETLKQFGVVMTEVNLQQFAYEQGIKKKISAMTQSEKVMLRYKYVTEQLAFIGNDFIDTQDSWANQTRILKEQWKELLSILGSGLITVLTPAVKTLNEIVSALINFANMAGKVLTNLFGIKSQQYSMDGIADSAEDAANATKDYGDAIEEAGKKAKGALLPFDELNVLQQDAGSGSSSSGESGGISTEDIEPTIDVFDTMDSKLARLLELLEPLKHSLKQLWDEGLSLFSDFSADTLEDFYYNFLVPVGLWTLSEDGLPRFFDITNELLKSINWSKLRSSLRDLYEELSELTTIGFDSLLDFYDYFLKPLITWGISEGLVTLLDVLTGFSKKVNWTKINTSLEKLYKVLGKFYPGIGNGLVSFVSIMADILTPVLAPSIELLADALGFLCDILLMIPDEYIEALGGALGGLFAVIITYKSVSIISNELAKGFSYLCTEINKGFSLMATHPYLAIAAGIAAVAAALAVYVDSVLSDNPMHKLVEEAEVAADNLEEATNRIEQSVSDTSWKSAGEEDAVFLQNLCTEYYNLRDAKVLSNEETERMKDLAEKLVESLPELQQYYDAETGFINTTKEAVSGLIEEKLKQIRISAAEEKYKEIYQAQLDSMDELKEATEKLSEAKAEAKALEDEYTKALQEAAEAEKAYKDAEAAGDYTNATMFFEQMADANRAADDAKLTLDALTNSEGYKELEDGVRGYTEQLKKSGEEMEELKGFMFGVQETAAETPAYIEEVATAFELLGDTPEEALASAKKAFGETSSAAEQCGKDYTQGFANGVEDGLGQVEKSIGGMTDVVVEGTQIGLDWHSPSKISMQAGSDYVLGFNKGIEENAETTKTALKKWLAMMEQLWNEYLNEWYDNNVHSYFDKSKWESLGKNMKDGLIKGFKGVLAELEEIIADMVSGCEKAIKDASMQFEELKKVSTTVGNVPGTVGASTYSNLNIPHLATGAIIPPNSRFLAMLGDQTSGYNIEAPASLIKDMVLQGIQESGNVGRGGMIELTVNLSGKQIHKEVVSIDKVYKTSTGYSAFEHK